MAQVTQLKSAALPEVHWPAARVVPVPRLQPPGWRPSFPQQTIQTGTWGRHQRRHHRIHQWHWDRQRRRCALLGVDSGGSRGGGAGRNSIRPLEKERIQVNVGEPPLYGVGPSQTGAAAHAAMGQSKTPCLRGRGSSIQGCP